MLNVLLANPYLHRLITFACLNVNLFNLFLAFVAFADNRLILWKSTHDNILVGIKSFHALIIQVMLRLHEVGTIVLRNKEVIFLRGKLGRAAMVFFF